MSTEQWIRIGCAGVLLLAALSIAAIYYGIQQLPSTNVALVIEERLAEQMVPVALDQWTFSNDSIAQEKLSNIRDRLLKALPNPAYDYHFYLVEDSEINALTLPGGHIVVFQGLLCAADKPEEVAAVIAHELGHAENHHVINRLLTESGIRITLALLLGQDMGSSYELSQLLISNYFSREQEAAADAWGFSLLTRAGISPKAHADFFRKIKSQRKENIPAWLSTHPEDESRINEAENYKLPPNFKSLPLDTFQWAAIHCP